MSTGNFFLTISNVHGTVYKSNMIKNVTFIQTKQLFSPFISADLL